MDKKVELCDCSCTKSKYAGETGDQSEKRKALAHSRTLDSKEPAMKSKATYFVLKHTKSSLISAP